MTEQLEEAPNTVSQNTTEQTLDVPVPEMMELPTIVSQNRIQRRTAEQIVDIPAPQVVEDADFKVFPWDRV